MVFVVLSCTGDARRQEVYRQNTSSRLMTSFERHRDYVVFVDYGLVIVTKKLKSFNNNNNNIIIIIIIVNMDNDNSNNNKLNNIDNNSINNKNSCNYSPLNYLVFSCFLVNVETILLPLLSCC